MSQDGDELRLRVATREDATALARWDRAPHVIAATSDDGGGLDIDWHEALSRQGPASCWYLAEWNGRPVGAMQIIDPAREPSHYWGACPDHLRAIDIWIGEKAKLGHGLGTRMMGWALSHCFASPEVVAVLVDPLASNVRAHRFYRRLGFRFVEKRRFDGDECHVYRLDRADWEGREPPPSAAAR